MKEIKLEINIQYCQVDELGDEDQELVKVAKEATQNSYAKYSHFCVGAAIRLIRRMPHFPLVYARKDRPSLPPRLIIRNCRLPHWPLPLKTNMVLRESLLRPVGLADR